MKIIHKKVVEDLRERIKDSTEAIVAGNLQNMNEYGYQCGYVRGLEDAVDSFEEIWQKYVNNPNEVD